MTTLAQPRVGAVILIGIVTVLLLYRPVAQAQSKRVVETMALALALEPDPAHGKQVYAKHCAACHGDVGQGNSEAVIPLLCGQVMTYLLKQLADMSEADRDVTEMHRLMARPELSTPQALRDLATFLNSLPVAEVPQKGTEGDLKEGARIYKSVCLACHGQQAQGDFASAVPALRGQHYAYLLMQLRQMAVGHRYSVDGEVIAVLETLSREELSAVSHYLSRLKSSDDGKIAALP